MVNDNDLSADNAGKLVLLTGERIRQLSKEGWIEKKGRGKFPALSVIHGYVRYLRDQIERTSQKAASTRMQDIKTEKAALELALVQKELLPRDDLLAAADFISATVKNEMLGLPARITRDLEERAVLEDEVRNALNRISKKIEGAVGAAVAGGDVFEGSGTSDT